MYCFLPSYDRCKGEVRVYDHVPEYVKDFLYSIEIKVREMEILNVLN